MMPPPPVAVDEVLPTLTPWHLEAMGQEMERTLGTQMASAGSSAWPAASLAFFVPFRLPRSIAVDRMFVYNGASAANSIDMGIYTEDGRRLSSVGLSSRTGTNALQIYSLSAAVNIGPGIFYMAIAIDNTTGSTFRVTSGTLILQLGGMAQQDLSGESTPGTLPATATLVAIAQAYLPVFGLIRTGFTI